MALIALTYVSMAATPMTKQEVLDILEVSRKNNAANNITGMLLYRDPYFIQVLEGEEPVINALYDKIRHDDRHQNILTVQKDPIDARSFSDWAMGFKDLDEVDPARLEGFTDFLNNSAEPSFFTEKPGRAKLLLDAFKNQTWW